MIDERGPYEVLRRPRITRLQLRGICSRDTGDASDRVREVPCCPGEPLPVFRVRVQPLARVHIRFGRIACLATRDAVGLVIQDTTPHAKLAPAREGHYMVHGEVVLASAIYAERSLIAFHGHTL